MGGNHQPDSGNRLRRLGAVFYGADAEVAAWVARRVPNYRPDPDPKALGVIKGGKMVAGVVYERWNGVHCEATIAVTDRAALDRRTMFSLFDYPFRQLDCRAISVLVSMSNLESLNLATKMGFEPQAIIKHAAPDGSPLIVLQQYRETCRWLRHGQGQQSSEIPGSV